MINAERLLLAALDDYLNLRLTHVETDLIVAKATSDRLACERASGRVDELRALVDWLEGKEGVR